jgi:hypothetical protein
MSYLRHKRLLTQHTKLSYVRLLWENRVGKLRRRLLLNGVFQLGPNYYLDIA